jgi:hypothetical protein
MMPENEREKEVLDKLDLDKILPKPLLWSEEENIEKEEVDIFKLAR